MDVVLDKGFKVDENVVSLPQFSAVKLAGRETVTLATAGDRAIGFLMERFERRDTDQDSVDAVAVRVMGIVRAIAGADGIDQDSLLAVGANGRLVEASGGDDVVGISMTPAESAGDQFTVLIVHGAALPA